MDGNGNIYACGESAGIGTDQDCLTVKYSSAGNKLWGKIYNGEANGWDTLEDIAIDSSGYIYATGSVETITDSNYITIKYSPADGNILWTASYSGTATGWDEAYAITITSDGNVAVTGYSESEISADAATVKYNSQTGAMLWAARYNGTGNSSDFAEAIAADKSGNIYITGGSVEGNSTDYLTICYGSNGTQLWKMNYNGPASLMDIGSAIAVDANAAIYVTGYSMDSNGICDYATIKYAPYYGSGNVDVSTRYQVLEGFGAAVAWWANLLSDNPQKSTLYNILFSQLGLDIYRIRNDYGQSDAFYYMPENAQIIQGAEESLGHPIKVMISTWSPPAYMKSNTNTKQGTLAKDEYGNYVYDDFAQWWLDSLAAWASIGVVADYVSMQNEPDWETPSWDTCRFDPTENSNIAGYKQAFEAFYNKINTMSHRPKILAPEAAGMTGSVDYINALTQTDKSHIYGYAHHLYNWGDLGDVNNPDGYIPVMTGFATIYNDKPCFQTEFSKGDQGSTTTFDLDAMNLAILIHNSLTIENVSSYIYWELLWTPPKGLVSIDSTSYAYTINPVYYAFKQYSKFTDPNWQRIEASGYTDVNDSNALRISAYISPDNKQLSVVIINTSDFYIAYNLSAADFNMADSLIYRTSSTENCVLAGRWQAGIPLSLPGRSITTVALTGGAASACPNPPAGDLNGDCQVDFFDIAVLGARYTGSQANRLTLKDIADTWLDCGLANQGNCWK